MHFPRLVTLEWSAVVLELAIGANSMSQHLALSWYEATLEVEALQGLGI